MQEFGLIKSLSLKTFDYLKACFSGFFPEHRVPYFFFFVSTLNSFQGSVEGQHLVVVMI